MRAEQRAIYQLLQPKSQFLMPEFQRRYVWRKKDVNRLWEDIFSVSQDPGSRHFLGAIVLSPILNVGGFKKRFVVDGQQRLTTLSILFCALRDHASDENPEFAKTINNVYLLNQGEVGEERFKLVPLAPADRSEWLAIVKRAATAGGDNLVGDAYRTFRRLLAGRAFRDHAAITRLEQTIAYQCDVVEVEVEPDRGDNEYRIFNSLNEGGVKLQQSDLIRSFMLMRLPNRSREVYERYWGPIQDLLESSDTIDELVQANLILRGRTRVSTDSVYREFRQMMQSASEDQVEAWASELFHQAQLYRYLVGEARHANTVLRVAVDRLVRWDSKAGHPLAVAILTAHEQGRLDQNAAAKAIRVVESYLVRRALVGIDSRGNAENIARVARDVTGRTPLAEVLSAKLAETAEGFPSDDQVRDAVVETNAYSPRGINATVRFVLRYIEDALEPREQVDLDDRRYTIEHILPQSLTDEWRASLAADVADGETIEDVQAELVHKLGNLTLTRYNQELDRDPWEVKRGQLARSGLAMNRDLATQLTWGRQQIGDRSIDLADRIVEIWPGPGQNGASTSVPAQASPDDVLVPVAAAAGPDATASVAPAALAEPPAEATPAPRRKVSAKDLLWSRLPEILAVIPAGRWTSYADIGKVLGVAAGEVGQRLSADLVNAHRVLRLHQASPRSEEQKARLASEGVRFENGKAAGDLRCDEEFLRAALDEGPGRETES
jgi:alkylated DNA nucleotide flippase Atl1